MDKYIIVTTLCDKKEIANKIQETLLSKRLISGCQISERESTYWWDGKIEKAHEYHLEMRTKESLFEEIESALEKLGNVAGSVDTDSVFLCSRLLMDSDCICHDV